MNKKPFVIISLILLIMAISQVVSRAYAIIVVAPVFVGLVHLILTVLGCTAMPSSILAGIFQYDKLQKSKKRFVMSTLATWIVLLFIIAVFAVVLITIMDIRLQLTN